MESGRVGSARTLPELDKVSPNPRPLKKARFGPTVVFPVHQVDYARYLDVNMLLFRKK